MEQVSEAWKEAQLQDIVPMSYIEISYNVIDNEAQAQAVASATSHETTYANTSQITSLSNKNFVLYATLEQNHWLLNKSFDIIDDDAGEYEDIGFVSLQMSASPSCTFTQNPLITITFPEIFSNPVLGVTIKWSETLDECARDFKVTAYNEDVEIATKTITDNIDNVSVVDLELNNYNKITIEVIEWCLPFKRARIEEILIGAQKVFGKHDLIGYSHEQYADILSGDLPKNSIVFEIDNSNQQYNPDNPQGLYKYLQERQEIKVRYGYKLGETIEWIKGGTFYLSEWNAPQNGITAQFTARDLLEFMTDKFVKTSSEITLYDLAIEVLTQSNLPLTHEGKVRWKIDESLEDITVNLPNDFDYTRAEVLQLIANAGMCVMYQDRDGIINIEAINTLLTDYIINRFNSYKNADYEITKELKSVDVNNGMGISTNSSSGEIQTVSNELIQESDVADDVASWINNILKNRKLISGEYRADPRLDALDKVTVINKYATNTAIITNIKYEYKGAFKGSYEGRVIDE